MVGEILMSAVNGKCRSEAGLMKARQLWGPASQGVQHCVACCVCKYEYAEGNQRN
jgi:hypothetical protein